MSWGIWSLKAIEIYQQGYLKRRLLGTVVFIQYWLFLHVSLFLQSVTVMI